ncbi:MULTISPECIES: phosphotransferase family protein [unclassified Pseudomonas]|uniref:phosphotransferase family protein n=1 Tax=unclassified Pseudomonas TaxID=196821 RepID=UPI001621D9A2|nr:MULTISPECIES: phosphotransferase family protein [unclassified Pseudomonas]MBB6290528.1 aminoglycoside phosphotransferase (APT) family kinase protein [Pseudomonas sp. SJZ073]MBB6315745.1 aminoglycoside phosphotransferase (APT) family kinase protein [Pseudomonas sp. JAI120]
MDVTQREAIEHFILRAAEASYVSILDAKPLSGGAIQENWLVTLLIHDGFWDGRLECVLRCDSPTAGVAISHGRAQEFQLLKTVFVAGVKVPEPLWLCEDRSVIGRPFFLMRRIGGTAAGHILVKNPGFAPDRIQLADQLGRELAKIHSVTPPHAELDFLISYDEAPAIHRIVQHRAFLDAHYCAYPALEWALRWLERHAPPRTIVTLTHGDYRTGNYMVDESGLTGILDWEFAGWGDPLEDIGWFCAKCWRFGKVTAEAGGIGARTDFYRGYEAESGRRLDHKAVHYWEVMAHVNWAIIAIQQAQRHCSGEEHSLLLALTGHIVPELEWELLNLTEND